MESAGESDAKETRAEGALVSGDSTNSFRQSQRPDGPSGKREAGNVEWEFTDTSRNAACRNVVAYLLRTNAFKNVMAVVILANAAAIGFESSARVANWMKSLEVLSILEQCFLSVYVIELGLRFYSFGWRCIYDNWVKFDAVLVTSGIATTWIMTSDDEASGQGLLVGLRLLRLVRLARTLRIIANVRDLWSLLQGFVHSTRVVAYPIGLLFIVIYLLSCIALELITLSPSARGPDANPEFEELVNMHFPDIGMTMLTLVQFASFDSIAAIYMPFILQDPMPPVLLIFFTFAFAVLGIILMNLITATIVNSAMDQANNDRDVQRLHEEKEKKKMIRKLRKMFWRLDTDGSGTITFDEITQINDADRAIVLSLMDVEPLDLFTVLDVNGEGVITIDGFCDGIWDVSHSQVPLEVKRTEQKVHALRTQVTELTNSVAELRVEFKGLLKLAPSLECGQEVTSIWRELSVQIQEGVAQRVRTEMERCRAMRVQPVPEAFGIPLHGPTLPDTGLDTEPAPPLWANVLLQEMQELRHECLRSYSGGAAAAKSALRQPAPACISGASGAVGESACFGNWQCLSPEADNLESKAEANRPAISEPFSASEAAEAAIDVYGGVLPGGELKAKRDSGKGKT